MTLDDHIGIIKYQRKREEKERKMIFNTMQEVLDYIADNQPENLDGHYASGELFDMLRNHAENARKDWWPSCKYFGYMEEYDMGEGESMEIDETGKIINSSVYF